MLLLIQKIFLILNSLKLWFKPRALKCACNWPEVARDMMHCYAQWCWPYISEIVRGMDCQRQVRVLQIFEIKYFCRKNSARKMTRGLEEYDCIWSLPFSPVILLLSFICFQSAFFPKSIKPPVLPKHAHWLPSSISSFFCSIPDIHWDTCLPNVQFYRNSFREIGDTCKKSQRSIQNSFSFTGKLSVKEIYATGGQRMGTD